MKSAIKRSSIVMAIDDGYVYPLLVVTFSLLKTDTALFKFIVAYDPKTLSRENLEVISKFLILANIEFEFYKLSIPAHWPKQNHINSISFAKVLLARDLGESFIWLDADILIRRPLDDLISKVDLLLQSECICARTEVILNPGNLNQAISSAGKNYFNAGVMIINPERWNLENNGVNPIDLIDSFSDYGFKWLDQDIFNYLSKGKHEELPEGYNFYVDRDNFYNDVKIFHYLGSGSKPWTLPTNRIAKRIHLRKRYYKSEYKEYQVEEEKLFEFIRNDQALLDQVVKMKNDITVTFLNTLLMLPRRAIKKSAKIFSPPR